MRIALRDTSRSPASRVVVVFLAAVGLHGVHRLAAPLGEPATSFVGYVYLFAVVVALVTLLDVDPLRTLGRPRGQHLLVGAVSGVGLFVVAAVGYVVVQYVGGIEQSTAVRPSGTAEWALVLGTLVLTVASEELAFRGMVLDSLGDVASERLAVLASAVLFSVYHLSVFQSVATFLLGLGFAGLVLRYGSLWPALVAHAVVNVGGLALFALSASSP